MARKKIQADERVIRADERVKNPDEREEEPARAGSGGGFSSIQDALAAKPSRIVSGINTERKTW